MSAVRGYAEVGQDCVAAAVGCDEDIRHVLLREAAALLTEVAATLPDCPTCGGTGTIVQRPSGPDADYDLPCSDCDHGKVTVAQMAATWQAVHGGTLYDHMVTENQADRFITGWFAAYDHLRSVRPVSPSPKEGP